MNILGLNAYHAEASAALIQDGHLVAAAEEERFVRVKHVAGFPTQAVRFCLKKSGVRPHEIDAVALSSRPSAHLPQRALAAFRLGLGRPEFKGRLRNRLKRSRLPAALAEALEIGPKELKAPLLGVEHHRAHLASSFYVSGMDRAALLSLDGLGDFMSAMWGTGQGSKMSIQGSVSFPHSLGFLYTALTQYLGFLEWGDEYKVMGLAALGKPVFLDTMRRLVYLQRDLQYRLHSKEFAFFHDWVSMQWDQGSPRMGLLFTNALEERLGPRRRPDEPVSGRHADIAASLQAVLEETVFEMLNRLWKKTRLDTLCLAGGVALNCVMNGKIPQHTPFKQVFVQPAAYDAGTALGAAYHVYHQGRRFPRSFVMRHAYWGPEFSEEEIRAALQESGLSFQRFDSQALVEETSKRLAEGKIAGWFQGAMEFGPRALGHRSLLADPRDPNMQRKINERIKRREIFRPFAPSLPREVFSAFFGEAQPDPFMVTAHPATPSGLVKIPAVLHVDGTGRPQAVDRQTNPLYWELLQAFGRRTGVPVLLNTSFNEREPIVCRPEEAIACFLRNEIDVLAIGPFLIDRPASGIQG
ncbi:MAG: carbamoyltransferase [Candidatus Omnitrophica bacterium]|nr:carbamoyltransferase [Candidatus Omnitrophota bacterium]